MATTCGSSAISSVSCTTAHWPRMPVSFCLISSSVYFAISPRMMSAPTAAFAMSVSLESKRGSPMRSFRSEPLAHLGPVVEALQHREHDEAAVGGAEVADERVERRRRLAGGRRLPRHARCPATPRWCRPSPTWRWRAARCRPPWASPVRSRWRSAAEMPPAMVMAPIESPNAGPGWPTRLAAGRTGVTEWRDARAGPEPERVVAAGVGVGTAVAVARPAHVDDVRVVGPDLRRPRSAAARGRPAILLVRKTSEMAASW